MITYFTEQDIFSFGSFILSKEREEKYIAQGVETKDMTEMLRTVRHYDIQAWFEVVTALRQEEAEANKANEDSEKETTDGRVAEPKIILPTA
jgi:hypothetical protein